MKRKRQRHVEPSPPKRSRLIERWLTVSFLAVVGTVLVLAGLGVRFGQG